MRQRQRQRRRRTGAGLVGGVGTCGAVYELKLAAPTKPLCLQHELNLCVCTARTKVLCLQVSAALCDVRRREGVAEVALPIIMRHAAGPTPQ